MPRSTDPGPERALLRLWIAQYTKAGRDAPKPRDMPQVHAVGPEPLRILLIGSGLSVGYGVLSHRLGLAGPLSAQVSALVHRGVDLDILSHDTMTAEGALKDLSLLDLGRFDAVVLTLGANEALNLTPQRDWRQHIVSVLSHLREREVTAFVVGIPSSEQLGESLDRIKRYVRQQTAMLNETLEVESSRSSLLTYLPIVPLPGRKFAQAPTRESYAQWAAQLSPSIARVLMHSARVGSLQDEVARQRALDALHILDTPVEHRFDRITEIARTLFGVTGAAVTFIDADRQFMKSADGMRRTDIPRMAAFCDVTIRSDALFIVEDASQDDRFSGAPQVVGPEHVRFYAGYPVESPDGLRVGALCVIDTEPREFTRSEGALLRDLAIRVQDELWGAGLSA